MRIATWNDERLKDHVKKDVTPRDMKENNANILVLTETDRRFLDSENNILTQDVPKCISINQIAVSKGFAGERVAVAEWNKDKSLSDHKGIVVEIN